MNAVPEAEIDATLKNRAAVAVIPLYLPRDDAPLEDVAAALGGTLIDGLKVDECQDVVSQSANADGVEEMTFSHRQSAADGTSIDYRFRLLRRGRRAALAMGLSPSEDSNALLAVEGAIAALQIRGDVAGSHFTSPKVQR